MTRSLIQVSDSNSAAAWNERRMLERRSEGWREGKEGGEREVGEEGEDVSAPPRPVSQSQRGRTTGHNGALQRRR